MENSICYIFGAGDKTTCTITLKENDLIIAADGGYDYACDLGQPVDVLIGDMDSIESSTPPANRLVHPKEKDDTDMMLALKYGLEHGYTNFHIYGGLGGRLDHTLANIQSLSYLTTQQASGILHGEDYQITAIRDSSFSLPAKEHGTVSIFSLSDRCEGVTIHGLKYSLTDGSLTNSFPLGVSNEYTGEAACITVRSGVLGILYTV